MIDRLAPLAILLALLAVAFLTVAPFLPAILWGMVLAIAVEPRHRRLVEALGERVLGAFLGPVVLAVAYEVVMEWIAAEPAQPAGAPDQ